MIWMAAAGVIALVAVLFFLAGIVFALIAWGLSPLPFLLSGGRSPRDPRGDPLFLWSNLARRGSSPVENGSATQ